MQSIHQKTERFEARLNYAQKQLIQQAADILGRSLTDFVISCSQETAKKVIRDHEIISLSREESIRFANALLNPAPPNAALSIATQRHQDFLSDQNEYHAE